MTATSRNIRNRSRSVDEDPNHHDSSMDTPFVEIEPSTSRGGLGSASSFASGIAAPLATQLAQQQAQNMAMQRIDTEAAMRSEKKWQKKVTIVVAAVAMSAFFVGLIAMWVEASVVAYLAFAFPLLTGPYVVHQRRKLNKLPRLCFVLNQVRNQVNRLMVQNCKLHVENNRLAEQITRLNEAERTLNQFAKQSGSDVQTICDLVQENAETQREMKVSCLCLLTYYCCFVAWLTVARIDCSMASSE